MRIAVFFDRVLVTAAQRIANHSDRVGGACRNFAKCEYERADFRNGLADCAFILGSLVLPLGVGYTIGRFEGEAASLKDRQITVVAEKKS